MSQKFDSSRERKRARFDQQPANTPSNTPRIVGIAALVLIAAAVVVLFTRGGDTPTAPALATQSASTGGTSAASAPTLAAEAGSFRIPVASITGQASFFKTTVGQTTVPFFAVRDSSGKPVVALDACQVCAHAKKGYRQNADAMQCVNCGMTFPIDKLASMGGKGGCHPITVPARVEGDAVVVDHGALESGAQYF